MQPDWVPPGIDTGKANIARVYDYWLGGSHNFRADQDAARAMIAIEPNTRAIMRANRAFLGRAVRFLAAEAGIGQFLDIGSGIPAEQNVHEVAHDVAPGTHVVYVDNDKVAVAHSKLMLEGNPDVTIIQADLREPAKILADPATQALIDFTKPVAVLLAAVLHFIPDSDDPAKIIGTLREAMAPGSYLAISHACIDTNPDSAATRESAYRSRVAGQLSMRTSEEIVGLFQGFTLVDPGVVWPSLWRPGPDDAVSDDPKKYWCKVGVGRLSELRARRGTIAAVAEALGRGTKIPGRQLHARPCSARARARTLRFDPGRVVSDQSGALFTGLDPLLPLPEEFVGLPDHPLNGLLTVSPVYLPDAFNALEPGRSRAYAQPLAPCLSHVLAHGVVHPAQEFLYQRVGVIARIYGVVPAFDVDLNRFRVSARHLPSERSYRALNRSLR